MYRPTLEWKLFCCCCCCCFVSIKLIWYGFFTCWIWCEYFVFTSRILNQRSEASFRSSSVVSLFSNKILITCTRDKSCEHNFISVIVDSKISHQIPSTGNTFIWPPGQTQSLVFETFVWQAFLSLKMSERTLKQRLFFYIDVLFAFFLHKSPPTP